MAPHKFVVLEGLDASGKTTLGEKLSPILGAQFIQTPGEPFLSIQKKVLTLPLDVQLPFFLAANLYASHNIKEMLATSPVVCARYVYTTLVAHCTYTGRDLGKVSHELAPFTRNLVMPDHIILVQVSEEEWYRRIQERGPLDANDLKLLRKKEYRLRAAQIYDQLIAGDESRWIKFDTTGRTIDECVSELASLVG